MSSNPLPNKITFQEKLVWNLRNNPNSKSKCRHQGKSSQNIKENQSCEILEVIWILYITYQNINVDSGSQASTLDSMCTYKNTAD